MKFYCLVLAMFAMFATFVVQPTLFAQDDGKAVEAAEGDATDSKIDMKDVSYVIGVNIGRNLSKSNITLDMEAFNEGFKAALDDADVKFDDKKMGEILDNFARFQQQQYELQKSEYLVKNKEKEGVKVTKSGLQYRVIKAGKADGRKPTATDNVRVHYTGKLINGLVFDSSVERGQPAEFGVSQVIPGWTEALQLMTEGTKMEIVLPSELGYGARGAGRDIGPNEVLVFEVELLQVLGTDKPEDAPEKE